MTTHPKNTTESVNNEWVSVLKELLVVAESSEKINDRTGVGTFRTPLFGRQLRFDLSDNHLPLVNVKRVPVKSMLAELLWFLDGCTDNNVLNQMGCTIWDEWANEEGQLGPVYGAVWRGKTGECLYDQVLSVLEGLIRRPFSRRHIITGWIPDLLPMEDAPHDANIRMGYQTLPPCHMVYQFFVTEPEVEGGKRVLHCSLYQRSMDIFLGAPFNIASASAMTHYFASLVNMEAGSLVITAGDCHLYSNHIEQAKECVRRFEEREYSDRTAQIIFKGLPENGLGTEPDDKTIDKIVDDLVEILTIDKNGPLSTEVERRCMVVGYQPLSTVKADVAV